MRRIRMVLAVAPFVAVLALAPAAAAQDGSPPADQSSGDRPTRSIEGPFDALERIGIAEWGEDYAGVWRDPDDDSAHVAVRSRTGRSVPASWSGATVHQVARSQRELEAFRERFSRQAERIIREDGVRLSMWGLDPASNSVKIDVIGTVEDLPRAREVIARAMGPGPVDLPITLVAVPGGAVQHSRTNDPDPHTAGALINNGTKNCTSGWYWQKTTQEGTHYRFLTAGHCLPGAFWWNNGSLWGLGGATAWNGLNEIGVLHVDAAALVPYTAGRDYVYLGGPTSNAAMNMFYEDAGWHIGITGVRTSGAVLGESQVFTGAVEQTAMIVAFYDDWGNFTEIRYWINKARCWGQPGDSGAPVFRYHADGDVLAMGIYLATIQAVGDSCLYTPLIAVKAVYGGILA